MHANALGAVEQPAEVKAGQRVVGMQPDQRGESRHRRGVAGLEFGERIGVLFGGRLLESGLCQRLVGAERLAAPA